MLIERYVATGQVRLVYHHLLDFGQRSLQASLAAECAGEQGAFWEMHTVLYERQDQLWNSDQLPQLVGDFAAELGLDRDVFDACFAEERYADKIRADDEAAKAAGIAHRPSFDINDRRLIGAQPFEQFQRTIEAVLSEQ